MNVCVHTPHVYKALAHTHASSQRCDRGADWLCGAGDELVSASSSGGALARGQVRDSNSPMLAAAVREAGALAMEMGLVRDSQVGDHPHCTVADSLVADLFAASVYL